MIHRIAVLAGVWLCLAAPGWAQGGSSRFLTGPIGWTPTISLRDVGVDSNPLAQPNPTEDRTGVFTAMLDTQMTLAHFKVVGTGVGDYVYFERLRGQRGFNRRFNVRVEAPWRRIVPTANASYQRSKEPQTQEVNVRTSYTTSGLNVGTSVFAMARGAIQVSGRREQTVYDQGPRVRGADIAERFNRDSDTLNAAFRFNLTELTTAIVDTNLSRDRFRLKPDQNTANMSWNASVEFAPDAVVRGRAGIGYHIMEPRGKNAQAFRGYTANVDLGYLFRERTRLNGRYFRDTTYSLEAPYFVQTTMGLDVAQLIGGPFELLARGNRERSNYPENAALTILHRIDLQDSFGGGIGIHISETARATITYELTRRHSSNRLLEYERRRVLTSFFYGF